MKNFKQLLKRLITVVVCAGMIVTQVPFEALVVKAEDNKKETAEVIYHTGLECLVDEEVSYPWQMYEEAGETGYKSSNQGVNGSTSELIINVSSDKPVRVRYDYGVSSESTDKAHFYCNDEKIWEISQNYSGHYDKVLEPGSYTLKFDFVKDGSYYDGNDTAYVKNISIISACKDGEHVYSDYDCLCDACEGYTYHKHEYDNNKCTRCGREYDNRLEAVKTNDGIHLVIDEDSDYAWQKEAFAYPWEAYEENGVTGLRRGNNKVSNSQSKLRFTIDAESSFRCAFDYGVSSESCDKFYIVLNGEPIVNGLCDNSKTGRFDEILDAGHYVFEFSYEKDGSNDCFGDIAYLSGIEMLAVCDNHIYTTYDCLCDRCDYFVEHYHEYDQEKTACIHCGKAYDSRIDAVHITNGGGIDFDTYEDYPWKVKTDVVNPAKMATIDGHLGLVNSNSTIRSSASNVTFVVKAEKRFNFSFNYYVESETNCDKMTIMLDDEVIVKDISGIGTKGSFDRWLEPGAHKVSYVYSKDGSNDGGRDIAFIYDISIDEPCDEHTFTKYECQCDNCDYYIKHTHKYENEDDEKCIRCGRKVDQIIKAVAIRNEVDVTSESESLYPWAYNYDENGVGIKSTNQGKDSTGSASSYIIDADLPCDICFDYMVDSENCDTFYATIDGKTVVEKKGGSKIKGSATAKITAGTHKLDFYYTKDGSVSIGLDTAYVYNISFVGTCADGNHVAASSEDMKDGTHKLTCSYCNVENHIEPHFPAYNAVYTDLGDGENHVTNCKDCDAQIIKAHNVKGQAYISAGDGTHYKECKDCGAHVETGECHGGKADCAVRAVCDDCHESYGQLSEEHEIEKVEGRAATCSLAGLTEGERCKVCNKVIKAQQEIAKLDHTKQVIAGMPATCEATGLTEGSKCSVCGEILSAQQIIAKLDHTKQVIAGKSATCEADGLTEGSKCSVCGKVLNEQQVIAKLSHKWDDGKIVKEPTYTEEGSREYTCEICNKTKTESIPVLECTIMSVQSPNGNFNVTLMVQDVNGKSLKSMDLSKFVKVDKKKVSFANAKKVKLTGYTFKGWYVNNKKLSSIKLKAIKQDFVVVARFAENTYSVNYKMVKPDKKTAVKGKIAAKNKIGYTDKFDLSNGTEITAEGYTLVGWSRKKNQTVADYQLGQNVNSLSDKNKAKVTLYPVWKKN